MSTTERPPRRQLRQFGWVLALVLALAALHSGPTLAALILEALAAVAFAVATLWPRALRGVQAVLSVVTAPVGWLVGRLSLALVYYGVLTPVGLALRLTGRDALRLRPEPDADSYWQPRAPVGDRRSYFRQF